MKRFITRTLYTACLTLIVFLTVFSSSAADEYSISIAANQLGVSLDEKTQLTAEVEGVMLQPEILWSSSDESVATVNPAGIVTGIDEGEAVITATAIVDGKEVSATYPVRVESEGKLVNTFLSNNHFFSYRFTPEYGGFYYNDDKVSWQTLFGFAKIYDYCAPMVAMEYDHLRLFYNYDGKDFLMEFWKGHYGAFIGCEIGLYHRKAEGLRKDNFALYATADEKYWPIMDMAFYRQEKEGDAPEDYKLEFKREVGRYWWCTGFIPGELRNLRPADELRIEATITFIDKEMADLTAAAMKEVGFKECMSAENLPIDSFSQKGESITFKWQGITESQTMPGFFGGIFSEFMAFLGRITEVFGVWIPKLLSL